jgi:hypothetical protein
MFFVKKWKLLDFLDHAIIRRGGGIFKEKSPFAATYFLLPFSAANLLEKIFYH